MHRFKTIFLITTLTLPGLQPLQSSTESCFDDFGLGLDFEADTPGFSAAIGGTHSKDLLSTANDSYNPDDSTDPFDLVLRVQSTAAGGPPSEEAIKSPTQPATPKKRRTAEPMLAVAAPAPDCASTPTPAPRYATESTDPSATAHRQVIAHKQALLSPSSDDNDDDSEDDDADENSDNDNRPPGEKPFSCEVCSKSFPRKVILIRHQRTHTGEKPYICDVCDKAFPYSSTLTQHKRTHTGEKPYTCNTCHKDFVNNSNLSHHKRTHTGEKPFSCKVCGKKFATRTKLTIHQRTHTGEKSFSCDVCDKSFATSSQLTRHKRTHTGDKPYTCDDCGKAFARLDHLTRHKKKMH